MAAGNYSFKQNVAQEVEDQLKRLRNHPSIVLWCGNNEQENNFLQDSLHVSQIARLQMWQDYLTVFSGIIPTLVARYDPGAAYWPSSPSGNYEETKAMNYRVLEDGDDVGGNEEFGDTHDYSVWTSTNLMPRVPFSSEEDRHYRFVSEYGFQSMPEMRTIDAFTLPEDRTSTSTPVMTVHQKDPAGYATMLDYIRQYYGQPRDFSSLVYASQVVQAEFIKVVAEHLRRDRPRTMGSIFWQLNDCWPVVSPSSIDYYGRWKALQYYARRFYSPLLVSSRLKDGSLNVSVVSDETTPTTASSSRARHEVRRNRAAYRDAEHHDSGAFEQGISAASNATLFRSSKHSGGDGFDGEWQAGLQQPDVSCPDAGCASSCRGDHQPFNAERMARIKCSFPRRCWRGMYMYPSAITMQSSLTITLTCCRGAGDHRCT